MKNKEHSIDTLLNTLVRVKLTHRQKDYFLFELYKLLNGMFDYQLSQKENDLLRRVTRSEI